MPTAAQAVTLFRSDNLSPDPPMVVQFIEYGIFASLQLTSLAETPFSVTDLLVNAEFRPTLSLANLANWFLPLQLPKSMHRGTSFSAILQAPAAAGVTLACCYPKAPATLRIATNQGVYEFTATELIRAIPLP